MNTIADRRTLFRFQGTPNQLRNHFAHRCATSSRDLFGGSEDIFIQIECRPHTSSITHQTSNIVCI